LDGAPGSSGSDVAKQLNSYISAVSVGTTPPIDALDFLAQQQHQYPKLVPHAQHLLSSPASQAYVERIFSVCGLLTSGRHNRMSKSLELHACLKLNSNVGLLKETRFVF